MYVYLSFYAKFDLVSTTGTCYVNIYQVMREFFESSPSRNASSTEPTVTADFEVMRQRLLDCLDSFTRYD